LHAYADDEADKPLEVEVSRQGEAVEVVVRDRGQGVRARPGPKPSSLRLGLRDTRTFFQHATEENFCAVIERLLKRKVRAFVSGIDTTRDVSAEIFYLETAPR